MGTNVQVVRASRIECVFNLAGNLRVYRWDVVVRNPDRQRATLPNGFRITEPAPTMPYAALLPVMVRAQGEGQRSRFWQGAAIHGPAGGSQRLLWRGKSRCGRATMASCWGYQTARRILFFNVTSISGSDATMDKATYA